MLAHTDGTPLEEVRAGESVAAAPDPEATGGIRVVRIDGLALDEIPGRLPGSLLAGADSVRELVFQVRLAGLPPSASEALLLFKPDGEGR